MHSKLRIERYFPDTTDVTDDASNPQPPGPELVPPHTPGSSESSVRPYFYRVPQVTPPPDGEAPPEQRRSTDDEPTGPRTK